MDWSFQIYSARKFGPLPNILETVAEAGYRQIEGVPALYQDYDAAALRALLDQDGLSMPTAHFSFDMLSNDQGQAFAIAETLGVRTMICPHIAPPQRPANAAQWRKFADRLAGIGVACSARGFEFAWHNHDFEVAALDDGTMPLAIILDTDPVISLEIDVAWIVRGGGDPLKWIDAYGDRIVAVHIKDIAEPGTAADEDGWADVGHGILDWASLLAALTTKSAARVFVLEHDNPSDFARFARRSIAFTGRL